MNVFVYIYMCVCFDDTERIRAVYISLRNFNTKILNVQSCMCVSIGYNEHFKRRNDMQLNLATVRSY